MHSLVILDRSWRVVSLVLCFKGNFGAICVVHILSTEALAVFTAHLLRQLLCDNFFTTNHTFIDFRVNFWQKFVVVVTGVTG